MIKRIACFIVFLGGWLVASADHITGGEMYYTFTGVAGGQYQYRVSVKLFKDCHQNRQFPNPAIISVFERNNNIRITDISVPLGSSDRLELTNPSRCITDPPDVCYDIGYYNFDVSLPGSINGYLIVAQIVFRVNGITNLSSGYGNVGATYTSEIPPTSIATAAENNSARFRGDDMVVVCADNSFAYNFGAEDADGDELRYSFCNAYQGGSFGGGTTSSPAAAPPYQSVPYEGGTFNGSAPLGGAVKIDPKTGMITGMAPGGGIYVVTVCVEEVRGGKVIATQRKDLQINITSCTIAAATLPPEYQLCDDTKSVSFSNRSTSPLIQTYFWDVSNRAGTRLFTSTTANPTYTFPDTGLYQVKLVINRNQECSDSVTSLARVYPGFKPAFEVNGICFKKPTNFIDGTTTVYGTVNKWNWDFGEISASNDVSDQQHPSYAYAGTGIKNVRLIVSDTKGCVDTIQKNVSIVDKPPIDLAFRDTLICVRDEVKLVAGGSGLFSWSPQTGITGQGTNTPTVRPSATITYYVDLDDGGCLNRDSVTVRVVDKVNVQAMSDTTICQGDSIRLRVASDGFTYSWIPAEQVNDPTLQNPIAFTSTTSIYEVTARIGSCLATDQVVVKTVPYPVAEAGADTLICHASAAQLSASMVGNQIKWSPATGLSASDILNPVARPEATTTYVLSVYDSKGCPKPGTDTVIVAVLPDINATAGSDTAVIMGQPLQLRASGGVAYSWSPGFGLSATNIADPVAVYQEPSDGFRYKVVMANEAGCLDSAYITVKVFQSGPHVFVPNAFTPNNDSRNDQLRPIAVGMQRIEQFIIYNRWGQKVFSTTRNGEGWDGTIGGQLQGAGVYVWLVKAVDFNGKAYFRKGMVALIR